MKVINTVKDLKSELSEIRKQGKKIGLVPTMGALHQGHASLVKRSVSENDATVVSVTYVFFFFLEEIYPEPDTRSFSYPPVDTVMEGARRPGHFNGVCQIVSKLFMMVEPDRAYFGEKDFQQIAVIRAMVADQKFKLEICPCPIVREADGLALSSRNTLLTAEERKIAVNISRTLFESQEYAKSHTLEETKQFVISTINAIDKLEVEYYEIVDGTSLKSLNTWDDSDYIVGCITVYCGDTPIRLIDNIKYKA